MTAGLTDPFAIRRLPRWHPARLSFTLASRAADRRAAGRFETLALPALTVEGLPPAPVLTPADWHDTAVTPEQMRHLLWAVARTESLGGAVVEVGSYRGVTTAVLAGATGRAVHAVDPYTGYGGGESDNATFTGRTARLTNIRHHATTSGQASADWPAATPVSLLFVDAMHDYVNSLFDVRTWAPRLAPGAVVAMHDVDNAGYPGTRMAASEIARDITLVAHIDNLALFVNKRPTGRPT